MRLWNRKKQADAFFPPRSRRSTCAERNLSSLHRRLARYARDGMFSAFCFLLSSFYFYTSSLSTPLAAASPGSIPSNCQATLPLAAPAAPRGSPPLHTSSLHIDG